VNDGPAFAEAIARSLSGTSPSGGLALMRELAAADLARNRAAGVC
jgi:hypothetical protein